MCDHECDTCLHSENCTHFEKQSENNFRNCDNYQDLNPDNYIENGIANECEVTDIWYELSYYKYTDGLFDYVQDYVQDYAEDYVQGYAQNYVQDSDIDSEILD
jgi:hypothetical protein